MASRVWSARREFECDVIECVCIERLNERADHHHVQARDDEATGLIKPFVCYQGGTPASPVEDFTSGEVWAILRRAMSPGKLCASLTLSLVFDVSLLRERRRRVLGSTSALYCLSERSIKSLTRGQMARAIRSECRCFCKNDRKRHVVQGRGNVGRRRDGFDPEQEVERSRVVNRSVAQRLFSSAIEAFASYDNARLSRWDMNLDELPDQRSSNESLFDQARCARAPGRRSQEAGTVSRHRESDVRSRLRGRGLMSMISEAGTP
ncbi:unnamed protein product [Trichogramma brassicae]|uniref:Uncharacterized protein n=1 Tax=Trichogramma brassicae TaxID=86971 RepID=A0A6H5INC5_9HYME|nr:unnamed protein product [Trichogramma brassicae]